MRSRLHLLLCLSPLGESFSRRARAFPGIISGCTINWFLPWPQAALAEVARRSLTSFEEDEEGGKEEEGVRAELVDHMSSMHCRAVDASDEYAASYRRRVYVAPRAFLSFLTAYHTLRASKKKALLSLARSIEVGLLKLDEASHDVDLMKSQLRHKEKGVMDAQEKAAVLLEEITACEITPPHLTTQSAAVHSTPPLAATQRAEKKKAAVQLVKEKGQARPPSHVLLRTPPSLPFFLRVSPLLSSPVLSSLLLPSMLSPPLASAPLPSHPIYLPFSPSFSPSAPSLPTPLRPACRSNVLIPSSVTPLAQLRAMRLSSSASRSRSSLSCSRLSLRCSRQRHRSAPSLPRSSPPSALSRGLLRCSSE